MSSLSVILLLLLCANGLGAETPAPSFFIDGGADAARLAQDLKPFFDSARMNIAGDSLAGIKPHDYVLRLQTPNAATLADFESHGAIQIVRSAELAKKENVAFIDLPALDAPSVVARLKALRENAIIRALSAQGRAVEVAPHQAVLLPHLVRPEATQHDDFMRWLNLPEPANPSLPTLFLIGDSTVRNGRGDGIDGEGQWGWGDPLAAYFDPAKMNVVNRAVGGTGAKTFTTQGYWAMVLRMLKPGDIIIMQFGHNDNGTKGALAGVTETGSFGWYLRQYITETRAKGATPILCTLIPRNTWADGKIARQSGSHADWARQVASAEKVPLLDLNEAIAQRYDRLGEAAVTELFADRKVHTSRAGAEMNAAFVISELRMLPRDPTAAFQRAVPAPVW